MAKVGILGRRTGADQLTSVDFDPYFNTAQSHPKNTFRKVYTVPADVKMSAVDIDVFMEEDNTNNFCAIDISAPYTTAPQLPGVLVIRARSISVTDGVTVDQHQAVSHTRKCLILGPGDSIFFRGPTDSNCVVTGIEHI